MYLVPSLLSFSQDPRKVGEGEQGLDLDLPGPTPEALHHPGFLFFLGFCSFLPVQQDSILCMPLLQYIDFLKDMF